MSSHEAAAWAAQRLAQEEIAVAFGWKAGLGCLPTDTEISIVRAIETALAAKWGVMLEAP